jgi:oligopeptide transport system substrate-binding protein
MRGLIISILVLAACRSHRTDEEYFGRVSPPSERRLRFEHVAEPESLDPTLATLTQDWTTIGALFEGLVTTNPLTFEPMAGIATHYEANADSTQFTFFLRGNRSPRGIPLPNTDSLPDEFRHGEDAAPSTLSARWSDGRAVTAYDFVFSWKRLLDPETASPNTIYVRAFQDMRALDDFTFQVDLKFSTPYLLKILWQPFLAPLRADGVSPGWDRRKFISNGPFAMGEWKPYEKIHLIKNPHYYEANIVALDELVFIPITEPSTYVNFYKAGEADVVDGLNVPKFFLPVLRGKKDFQSIPLFMNFSYSMNLSKPPVDNALVRYALNMATDKQAIARLFSAIPAPTFVPDTPGYVAPARVDVEIGGKFYDVLAYDPAGAREVLTRAGYSDGIGSDGRRLNIPINFSNSPLKYLPEILQQQWRDNLHIEVTPLMIESKVMFDATLKLQYSGLIESGWFGTYLDPDSFLLRFPSDSLYNGTGFRDSEYDRVLTAANRTLDPQERMGKLADAERRLMQGMPLLPIFFDTLSYLQKPYVRGLRPAPNGTPTFFKYAQIDMQFGKNVNP